MLTLTPLFEKSVNLFPEFIDLLWHVQEDNVIKSIATENKENTGFHLNNSGCSLGVSIKAEEQVIWQINVISFQLSFEVLK